MGDPRRKLTTVGRDGLAWHRDGDPWDVPVDGSWVELGREAGLNYGARAGMIPTCRMHLTQTFLFPVSVKHREASALELALHYANRKTFSWLQGGCVCLVSLVFTVKLFKTNLDVATLFFPITL